MPHSMTVRVYYEDTDLAGVVYYANYLRFIERGRTEALRAAGVDQGRLKAEDGAVFVVRRIEADYLAPAKFDDMLAVATRVEAMTGATVTMAQEVARDGVILFRARVVIACMGTDGRPRRLPGVVREALAPHG
ncbi:tol-pal system-associated acyl-CoA thioesterase [Limibaculum sp. M0105]|uniref:Tol-pal system-associated acyl-CoA thioesterase n=1 Tax=Thermohalobaculum xanthum TaxID=2753746 RepID=A0A8J7M7W1_9RHOB|nr:tol-pal system-associated acyl-CoA thioesterase [Thermohalobaculum xanthum]MBK0399345.1 tol-pal system-associated acyl-CoA thioesterase [Thermohalobaculum xanthum]